MTEKHEKLVTPDDERVLDALRIQQQLQVPADLYHVNDALRSLAIEELRGYHRTWSHPLGFVLKS